MERRWDLDLTYVTERILAAAFPARPDEQRHRGHLRELAHVLQSKHRDKYLVRGGASHSRPMIGLGDPDGRSCPRRQSLRGAAPGGRGTGAGPREPIGNAPSGLSRLSRALGTAISSFGRETLLRVTAGDCASLLEVTSV